MACVTKKRGKWAVDFYDQHGTRRLRMLPKGANKAEARKLLRKIEDQVSKRCYLPVREVPTFGKVAENWLQQKRQNVRGSTLKMYRGHVNHHFEDIKFLKIDRISIATAERFITERQNKGMNLTTLRKIIVTFNQIMNYAVRHRYIDHNPVREAERPRNKGEFEKPTIKVLSPSDINTLLESVSSAKFRMLFMLAIMSGARQGELFGLKWADVDWFNKQIRIQRTYNFDTWYKPKSKTSNRKIDIGPSVMRELKAWKLACPPNALDLIFPNEVGKPLDHGNVLQRHFYPALKTANLPTIRFHDLRHTYASLLIEQGENIKYIQSQLGHANPTVTLNVYAHLMKPVNQEAAVRLDKVVFEKSGDQMETKTKQGATE
ncbi:MAG: tyrosine-type recombinase/integrase [Desulfobacteraceae bacterium]|nr:tyrosine-type recombinase/integrase [Desulfobacteraceae bacterium]MBC2748861.1 tyrosine-type recombinase/integrase [Desulfobacteraceae bacterium]